MLHCGDDLIVRTYLAVVGPSDTWSCITPAIAVGFSCWSLGFDEFFTDRDFQGCHATVLDAAIQ